VDARRPLSALLPRELEGMLVLLTVVAMQLMLNPDGAVAHLLPFWFSREIGFYAVDHGPLEYLLRGLVHAAVVLATMLVAVGLAARIRLRRRPHLSMV
jgi:hypothetical protein